MSGIIGDNTGRGTGLIKAAAGGAWNLLSTTTASDDATLEITANIDSTYAVYAIQYYGVSAATDDTYLRIRLSKDGGSNWEDDGGDYQYAGESKSAGGEEAQTVSTSATFGIVDSHTFADSGGDASVGREGLMFIHHASSTSKWTVLTAMGGGIQGDDYAVAGHGCIVFQDDAAINAIQFYMSSGNMTTGTFKLYGIS